MAILMGVLNVTPDSFSDGGRFSGVGDAVAAGRLMAEQGADYVDVGGESTRPGANRISLATEAARVVPVIESLARDGVSVSIDTMRAAVARAAVAAGAVMVNDVSGGLADPAMLATVAELRVPYVAMHWRAHSAAMQDFTDYDDVIDEVCESLSERAAAAEQAGIVQVIVDPGLGFAKTPFHNWQLLHSLDRIVDLGWPVLIGASRKRFLGDLVGADVAARDSATAHVTALAVAAGAWGVRVHDVAGNRDAVRVGTAWREGHA